MFNNPIAMRHLSTLLQASLVLSLLSCGAAAPDANDGAGQLQSDVQRSFREVVITSGTPLTIADLSISGMSCEMMCGGSIRKALAKLPGVEGTEIKFDDAQTVDHAIVTFDAGKVSEQALIDAVHGLYDGQYKVSAIAVTQQIKGEAADASDPDGASRELGVGAYHLPLPSLPSVLDILSRIVRP